MQFIPAFSSHSAWLDHIIVRDSSTFTFMLLQARLGGDEVLLASLMTQDLATCVIVSPLLGSELIFWNLHVEKDQNCFDAACA